MHGQQNIKIINCSNYTSYVGMCDVWLGYRIQQRRIWKPALSLLAPFVSKNMLLGTCDCTT